MKSKDDKNEDGSDQERKYPYLPKYPRSLHTVSVQNIVEVILFKAQFHKVSNKRFSLNFF